METYQVHPVGKFRIMGEESSIEISEQFCTALKGLEGFSHLVVIWWFSDFDSKEARDIVEVPQPYRGAPEMMGIFATRSPVRPNPLGITVVEVQELDVEKGIVKIPYTDAHDGTPLLDLKPYTPSIDRVDQVQVPEWCRHWPMSLETSGDFDWENEFNF